MKVTLTLLTVAVVALAVGFTRPATGAATVAVPKCPSHAPRMSTFDTDVGGDFVRRGAEAMRLCRYYGLNWGNPRGLAQQRLIGGGAAITRITRAFNTLHEVRGVYHCPLDDGAEMLAVFAFPHSHAERVVVQLSGCRFTSNGGPAQQVRWTTRRLRRGLLNLVEGS